jgi:hypothetical protein
LIDALTLPPWPVDWQFLDAGEYGSGIIAALRF